MTVSARAPYAAHQPMPQQNAADAVFARRNDVILRDVAGERLLVPIRRDAAELKSIFMVTGVGAFVWELLDGERSLEAVLAAILDHYEVGAEEARVDLRAFVERLAEAGIAERRS